MKNVRFATTWSFVLCLALCAFGSTAFAQGGDPEGGDDAVSTVTGTAATETSCDDKVDNDGDTMTDCADSDCYEEARCHAGGSEESTNERCSDWIDNDGDGLTDCDDSECSAVPVCKGSADRKGAASSASANMSVGDDDIPDLKEGMSVDDLVGSFGDKDGERSDETCSDGVDNDEDGRTDCADFGCRFDASVTVCAASPEFRFSVVAGMGVTANLSDADNITGDARFDRIQFRALGPIPYIDHSFFLLSMRAERTPRLTFAMFQVPIGGAGHYFQINSGGGNLSSGPIISIAKQPLLDPAFYLFNAFEQPSGAVLEVGGPLTSGGGIRFRTFLSGGSGVSNGNVGGRFFRNDDRNFNWNAGAQIGVNLIGHYSRYDTKFIYVPVPTTLAFQVGAKYDQRSRERYPAGNVQTTFRTGRFILDAETYGKYVLDYKAVQFAWNVMAGVLIMEKTFFLAADIGSFVAQDFDTLPVGGFDSDLRRPLGEFQARGAFHWYFFRNIGVLSLLFTENHVENDPDNPDQPTVDRQLKLEAQFRF